MPNIKTSMPIREQIKELTLFITDRQFALLKSFCQPYKNAGLSMNAAINMLPNNRLKPVLTQVRNTMICNLCDAA